MLNEGMTGDLRDLTFVASEIGKQLNTIFIEELATRRSIKSAASLITNSLARAGLRP